MKKEEIKRLEGYSRAFAQELFRRYPAWLEHAELVITGEPGLHVNYLEVSVPSPNPRVEEPLVICTERAMPHGEVTVSWFGGWHVHVHTGGEEPCAGDFNEVLELIERIVRERYVVAIRYVDGRPVGGSGYRLTGGRPAHLEEAAEVRIRSWLGTHDEELYAPGF